MRIYAIIVLIVVGCYYYVSRKVRLDAPLSYASKYKKESWAPAADYYIGLAYYQRGDYPNAQAAFSQLLADHATSQYSPKGLMYLADSAEWNFDWEASKAALVRYLEEYPDGGDKQRAEKKLEFLRYKHGP